MHAFEKLVSKIIPLISLLALEIIPSVDSSSNENHLTIPHQYIKHGSDHHKVNRRLVLDIKLHGILSWASMGFLVPLGMLTIRMFKKEECSPRKLKVVIYSHAILQVLAVLLATAGAILSLRSFENSFNNNHQRIGLALYVAIWVQALMGLRRPNKGTKGRTLWFFFHWIFGTTVSLAGIFNTYTGLHAYHIRTSKSTRLWSILFAAEVSFMAFLYLFQEKWEYLQKQGVIAGDEPLTVISTEQVDDQKDAVVAHEPRRKSNSLENYFAKSNALKKLFQVT